MKRTSSHAVARAVARAAALAVLLVSPAVLAADHPSIGKIVDGGTVFCISKQGIFVTADHCVQVLEQVTIMIGGRRHAARIIRRCQTSDGPTLLHAFGVDFTPLPLAAKPAAPGDQVSCVGYDGRDIQLGNSGKVTHFSDSTVRDTTLTVAAFNVRKGMSGCPLLNSRGEVVGVLWGREDGLSYWFSLGHLKQVCQSIEPTDLGLSVLNVPLFNISCKQNRCPSPDGGARDDGLMPYIFEPPPAPDIAPPTSDVGVDWSYVKFVPIASVAAPKALGLLVGPCRRIVSEVTKDKAKLQIVAERVQPVTYGAVTGASGMAPAPIGLLVLVKHQDVGLIKGKIAQMIESKIRPVVGNFKHMPVEIIFERAHPADFAAIEKALSNTDEKYERSGSSVTIDAVKLVAEKVADDKLDKLDALKERVVNLKERLDERVSSGDDDDTPWYLSLFGALFAGTQVPLILRTVGGFFKKGKKEW